MYKVKRLLWLLYYCDISKLSGNVEKSTIACYNIYAEKGGEYKDAE